MVNHQPHRLDDIFAALSDPTRRAVLTRLSEAPELSVTALAAPFAMSLPAVLKHLDVLEVAGLIRRRKIGRTVSCRLTAAPLQEAQRWLRHYEQFWADRLDTLARYLADEASHRASRATPVATTSSTPDAEPQPCPATLEPLTPRAQNQVSPSGERSRRRRTSVSARGRTRKR